MNYCQSNKIAQLRREKRDSSMYVEINAWNKTSFELPSYFKLYGVNKSVEALSAGYFPLMPAQHPHQQSKKISTLLLLTI